MKLNPTAPDKEIAAALGFLSSQVANVRWRDKKFGMPRRKYKSKKYSAEFKVLSVSTGTKSLTQLLNERKEPNVETVDVVNHPAHYKVGGIETIDFIKAKLTPEEFKGYLLGNVLKYASRAGHKDNALQDAGKMAWYANRLAGVK
jgi:hypothetical protein